MKKLPDQFSKRIVGAFGERGADWLQILPQILDDLSSRWQIRIEDPFPDMAYNFVAPGFRKHGAPVVVKVGVPNSELAHEIGALRAFDGHGVVALLEVLPEYGAFLLERLLPGEPVLHVDDETATSIAGEVMRQIWQSGILKGDFPSVSDWAKGFPRLRERFGGGTGPFPKKLVETAEALFRDLLSSMDETILLHGDLHHWNILSADREPWLAIDPKGVLGEPAYEVGAWLRNPFPQILTIDQPEKVIARRLDQFADQLMLARDRMLGWGIAQAVLAAWWSFEEDRDDWDAGLACADIMSTVD